LQQAGFVAGANQDKFVNRLMFPITDVTGRVIAFGGRTLNDTGAKYINSPTTPLFDKSGTLYGLEQARHRIVETGTAVVVEGYTDVIMPHQFGCTNVVATLGTSFTAAHGRILRRYAKRVILLFDSDTAGMAAANRALEVCLSQHLDIRLAFVPQGKDPCEFLLAAGKEGFDRVVAEGTDVLKFKWDRLSETFAADDTLASRKAALDEFLQAVAVGLASNNLPILESGLIVNRVAKIIGRDGREINGDLNRRMQRLAAAKRGPDEPQTGPQAVDWGQGLYAVAQREVLEVLLNEPGLVHNVERSVAQDMFDVPILGQIASILLDVIRSDGDFSLSQVLGRIESVELAECVIELQRVGEQKGNYPSRLVDALEVLSRRRLRTKDVRTNAAVERGRSAQPPAGPGGRQNPHSIGIL
jgi:DNA primase